MSDHHEPSTGRCVRCTKACSRKNGDFYFCCGVFICEGCRRPALDTKYPTPHSGYVFHFRWIDADASDTWKARATRLAKYYLNHGSTPELQTLCREVIEKAKREDAES